MWSCIYPELESPFAPTPPEHTGAHFHLLCVLGSKEISQLEPMEVFRQINLLLECNTLEKSQVQLKCPWEVFLRSSKECVGQNTAEAFPFPSLCQREQRFNLSWTNAWDELL